MAEVARGVGGAALQKGCPANFHLQGLRGGGLRLSRHTWGAGGDTPAVVSAPAAPRGLPSQPAPCSFSSGRGPCPPEPQPPSTGCPRPPSPPVQGSRGGPSLVIAGGDPEHQAPSRRGWQRGNPGGGPRGRPLSFQAPSIPSELRVWECKACARLGHTGPFVSPHRREDLTTLPPKKALPKFPTRRSEPTPARSSHLRLPKRYLCGHPTRSGDPQPGSLVSTKGSESPPGVRVRARQ